MKKVSLAEFKEGDWVFHDFTLGQLEKTEYGMDFRDGAMRCGGKNIQEDCVPLNMTNKIISDEYMYWSKKIHSEGTPGLNYPDIHRWLVGHWLVTCHNAIDERSYYEERYGELRKFAQKILDKCREFKLDEVDGVRIGR